MRTKSKVSLRRMSMKNGLRIGRVRVMAGRNCRACGQRAHPERHLGKFRGTLQADTYAEFNQLYDGDLSAFYVPFASENFLFSDPGERIVTALSVIDKGTSDFENKKPPGSVPKGKRML